MHDSDTRPAPIVPDLHRQAPQHLARRFAQICNTLLSGISAPHGLMPWHFALLAQMRAEPGLDRTSLALAIGCDATSTGQALDRLEARGLVARTANPDDRRAAAWTLTEAGEALFAALAGPTRAVARQLLAPLSDAEAATLLALLARLVDAHEAHARPGAGRRPPRRKPE